MKDEGRVRVVISGVQPEIECGRFPIKRTVGEKVVVEADIFADGHEALSGMLLYRHAKEEQWSQIPLQPLVNDRWRGEFVVTTLGQYLYTLQAWIDRFTSWRRDLAKRIEAGQDIAIDLLVGAALIAEASGRAEGEDAAKLKEWAAVLRLARKSQLSVRTQLALTEELSAVAEKYPDRQGAATYDKQLAVVVDRERARFSTWYEMFPRSCAAEPGHLGTFKDCEARLPYVAAMGFDVLYLPPIHPIGQAHRKGKNNAPVATADDPG
ncbi:MAG: maltotransferase domain-containing protein, partial [Candidatus Binatia bacterium]